MRRLQLFEFGDQPWMRGWLREAYLDALNFALRVGRQYRGMCNVFSQWTARAGSSCVLDLGSGGAGPIETLVREGRRGHVAMPEIVLSDLYPSLDRYARLAETYDGEISYITGPVSADHVDNQDIRLRSLCSTFHHFPPETARRIIEDAARNSDGVFIMEPFMRDWRHFLLVLLTGPFIYMVAPFFSGRFEFRKVLACTVLPVVPAMLIFDGCVSVMRVYAPQEIESMLPEDVRGKFTLQSGHVPYMRFFSAPFFCFTRTD
jgi:hypothetical protein